MSAFAERVLANVREEIRAEVAYALELELDHTASRDLSHTAGGVLGGHTPGPWEVRLIDGTHFVVARDQDGEPWTVSYAVTPTLPPSEPDANAHLIAAAPVMYEAMLAFLEVGDCKASRTMAEAALAKAEAAR